MRHQNKGTICALPECQTPAKKRGYCDTHYRRLRKHGDATVIKRQGNTVLLDWIERHKSFDGEECLPWPFNCRSDGQGQITVAGENFKAPPFMCLKAHGAPEGDAYEAVHSCGNSRLGCINPRHLSWQPRKEKVEPITFKACSVDGCEGNAHYTARGAYGYCRPHYRRWKTHGDPMEGYALWGAAQKFFDEVVIPCRSDDCLIWPYGKANGYGRMNADGTPGAVHRMACIEVHGEPPTPMHEVAHSCGRGGHGCVNPRHLRWATGSENQMDRVEHGTSNRGERCGSAKLTAQQVLHIREQLKIRPIRQIAMDYGVSHSTISLIHRGKNWAWLQCGAEVTKLEDCQIRDYGGDR